MKGAGAGADERDGVGGRERVEGVQEVLMDVFKVLGGWGRRLAAAGEVGGEERGVLFGDEAGDVLEGLGAGGAPAMHAKEGAWAVSKAGGVEVRVGHGLWRVEVVFLHDLT